MRLDPNKWYFNAYVYIIAFLCIGPLALPLVWLNPRYDIIRKAWITLLTLIVSYLLAVTFAKSMSSILQYYQQMGQLNGGAR